MPTTCIPLDETNRSIFSKAYYGVIQQILHQIQIPYGTLIAMHKGLEINRTDNETNLTSEQKPNLPSTVAKRKVTAEITEDYNEDALSTTAVSYRDTAPIFVDPQIDFFVYPVYVTSDIGIKLTFSTPSKAEAQKLRDDIRIKLSQMRNILHHEIEYDILLPRLTQTLIEDVYDLKNRLHPMSMGEYFHTFSTRQTHMVTDLANKSNAQIAIRERQVRIVGKFEFSSMPEPIEEDNENNTYRLVIPYKFTMEVPRGMCMEYNPIICNRPLPAKYLQHIADAKVKTREEYSRNLTYTNSLGALSRFEAHRQLDYRINNKLPLNLPFFDEFPQRKGHPGYVITTTFLTSVDETDRQTLFNLRDIPDFYMNEDVLRWLEVGERLSVTVPYRSVFYFGLHYPDRYYDKDCLELTPDLTLKSKVKLPLDKPTRVAFSILTDLAFLNDDMRPYLYQNKDIFLIYLSELVTVIRDYRQEIAWLSKDDLTFQMRVLYFLNRALNDKDEGFIREVVDIIARDKILAELVGRVLKQDFPSVFNRLNTYTDMRRLDSNKTGRNTHYDRMGNYASRTVMISFTEARRKDELDSK